MDGMYCWMYFLVIYVYSILMLILTKFYCYGGDNLRRNISASLVSSDSQKQAKVMIILCIYALVDLTVMRVYDNALRRH